MQDFSEKFVEEYSHVLEAMIGAAFI